MSRAGCVAHWHVVVTVTEREDKSAASGKACSQSWCVCGRAGCSLLFVTLLSCAVWYSNICHLHVVCHNTALVCSELSLILAVLGDYSMIVRELTCHLVQA